MWFVISTVSLLARLMSQYCFVRWRLSSSVTLPADGRLGAWAVGRPTLHDRPVLLRDYVPLGRHLVESESQAVMYIVHCSCSNI